MEPTFTKNGNKRVAEVEVTSDFNLHIEKEHSGETLSHNLTSLIGLYVEEAR